MLLQEKREKYIDGLFKIVESNYEAENSSLRMLFEDDEKLDEWYDGTYVTLRKSNSDKPIGHVVGTDEETGKIIVKYNSDFRRSSGDPKTHGKYDKDELKVPDEGDTYVGQNAKTRTEMDQEWAEKDLGSKKQTYEDLEKKLKKGPVLVTYRKKKDNKIETYELTMNDNWGSPWTPKNPEKYRADAAKPKDASDPKQFDFLRTWFTHDEGKRKWMTLVISGVVDSKPITSVSGGHRYAHTIEGREYSADELMRVFETAGIVDAKKKS